MIYLDTSCLVRFFTKDQIKKAKQVKKLIESSKKLAVSDVVFPELEYVLSNLYQVKRQKLIRIYQFLKAQKNIRTSQTASASIGLYSNSNLDMADCMIAVSSRDGKLASYDEQLLKAKGVKSYF